MTLITMPSSPGIAELTWKLQQPTQVNRSEFTSRRRVTILAAAPRWSAGVKLVTGIGEAAVRPWRAFFASLQGQANQFRLVAVEAAQISGVAITVNGEGQSGRQLSTAGWGSSGFKLSSGCLVTINDQLLQLTSSATADSDGRATLYFQPALRSTPSSGAAIVVDRPYALMSLTDDLAGWMVARGRQYTIEFNAEESF